MVPYPAIELNVPAPLVAVPTDPVRRAGELTALLQMFKDEFVPAARALRQEDLVAMAAQGMSHAEIGTVIGVSAARVTQLINSPRLVLTETPTGLRWTEGDSDEEFV